MGRHRPDRNPPAVADAACAAAGARKAQASYPFENTPCSPRRPGSAASAAPDAPPPHPRPGRARRTALFLR